MSLGSQTLTVTGTLSLTDTTGTKGSEILSGGILDGSGTVNVNGSLVLGPSSQMNGTGTTAIKSGASATIDPGSGADTVLGGDQSNRIFRIDVGGTATWVSGDIVMGDGSKIDNAGTFEAMSESIGPGTGNFGICACGSPDADPPPLITNTGTFSKTSGTGTTFIGSDFGPGLGVTFVNQGAVDLSSGTLRFASDATPFSNAGAVTIGAGSTIETDGFAQTAGTTTLGSATSKLISFFGTGQVAVSGGSFGGVGTVETFASPGLTLSGTGTISPGFGSVGTLTLNGSYAQTGGTLAVQHNGTGAAQIDKLAVSGSASFGGTLAITTGYAAALGDTAIVVTASSTSGVFTAVTGADLPGALSYQVQVNATNVRLKVVRPILSVANVSVSEGNSGTKNLTFTLTLSEASAATLSANWQTALGMTNPATPGNDYTAANGTATWNHLDALSKTVSITIFGDNVYENDETLKLSLSMPVNLTFAANSATGTITNDDPIPTITVVASTPSLSEGNSGTTAAGFTVSLSNPSSFQVTADYTTQDDTATTADSDYQSLSGTLTYAPLDTSEPLSVLINGDTKAEPTEQFQLAVTSCTGCATPGTASATQTITNDDASPAATISIGDIALDEGDAGTKTAKFLVTLSQSSPSPVTVKYRTQNGSATAGSDFVGKALTTFSIPANTTSKNVLITINGDTTIEPNESFSVLLSNPSAGYTIADSTGIGTIRNDDVVCDITGTPGDDNLVATSGSGQTICGLGGNDIIHGGAGPDTILGGSGNDQIFGGGEGDQIHGGDGNDALNGEAGNDEIEGAAGNDTVRGGAGEDTMTGGDGTDTLSYSDAGTAAVTVSLAITGVPQSTGGAGVDQLNDQGFENLIGGGGADTLTGSDGNNTINGMAGNDHLSGGAGTDTCNGGAGPADEADATCETKPGIP